MNVTLNIESDAELRAYIKDCIKGQVLSIVREDFMQMIVEELTRKTKGLETKNFDRLLHNAVDKNTKELINKDYNIKDWGAQFVKPVLDTLLNNVVNNTDWTRIVDELAKEKIRNMIK